MTTIAIYLLALVQKCDGLIELPLGNGRKITLAYNDGQWVVLHDPGKRRHRQTFYRGRNVEEAFGVLTTFMDNDTMQGE